MTLGEYILELKDALLALQVKVKELEARLSKLEPRAKTKAEAARA